MAQYHLVQKFSYVLCLLCRHWGCLHPLGKIISESDAILITILAWGQSYQIDANFVPSVRHRDWMKGRCWTIKFSFGALTVFHLHNGVIMQCHVFLIVIMKINYHIIYPVSHIIVDRLPEVSGRYLSSSLIPTKVTAFYSIIMPSLQNLLFRSIIINNLNVI